MLLSGERVNGHLKCVSRSFLFEFLSCDYSPGHTATAPPSHVPVPSHPPSCLSIATGDNETRRGCRSKYLYTLLMKRLGLTRRSVKIFWFCDQIEMIIQRTSPVAQNPINVTLTVRARDSRCTRHSNHPRFRWSSSVAFENIYSKKTDISSISINQIVSSISSRLPPGWSPAFGTAGCPTKEPDDEQVERTRTGKSHRLGRGIRAVLLS